MYKIPSSLLEEIKKNLVGVIEELWLSSELTPEEFAELKQVIESKRLIKLLEDEFRV